MTASIQIRPESPGDEPAIARVLTAAFPTDLESRLVAALRDAGRLTISLVAEVEREVVAHLAFSPVTLVEDPRPRWLGLAPIAVAPPWQRQGIGRKLIQKGMSVAAQSADLVVVLGEPAYYRQFGFVAATQVGLQDEYGGGPAFQVREFVGGAIPSGGGLVRYAAEFAIFEPQ